MTKDDELKVRIAASEKDTLQRAASAAGVSMSRFVREAARREALAVLAAAGLQEDDEDGEHDE